VSSAWAPEKGYAAQRSNVAVDGHGRNSRGPRSGRTETAGRHFWRGFTGAVVRAPGCSPTAYAIRYDDEDGSYAVVLEGLRSRP